MFALMYDTIVKPEFTAVIEHDGDRYIGYCPEIPGANGPGRSIDEGRQSLREAIQLILEDRRKERLRGVPDTAIREILEIS